MRLPSALVVVVLLAGAATRGEADIYVWRDNAGVSHYTNSLENVPPEYRQNAMTVAKDWARAEPPPEPEPVAAPPAAPAPAAAEEPHARAYYDAGYAAGLRVAENPGAVASSSVGPVVQNLQVPLPPERERIVPFIGPVIVERRKPTPEEKEENRALPPARPAPFLQGPAGPPPVSNR